jgi:prepilin peptidase CpaA
MTTYTLAQAIILGILQLLIIAAALHDATRLRISNLFPLAIIAAFVGWVVIVGFERDLWQNLLGFLLCLAGGTFLFSKSWLGGGDVKLLAALALWFDLDGAGRMLVFTAMGGGLLALAIILGRRMVPLTLAEGSGWAVLKRRGPIPYGVAIAAGALLAIHLVGVNPMPLSPLQQLNGMIKV